MANDQNTQIDPSEFGGTLAPPLSAPASAPPVEPAPLDVSEFGGTLATPLPAPAVESPSAATPAAPAAKETTAPPPEPSAANRMTSSFLENSGITAPGISNMTQWLQNLHEGGAYMMQHPDDSIKLVGKSMMDAQSDQAKKALESYGKGDYAKALAYAVYSGIPVAGPIMEKASEKIAAGDYAGAAGTVLAVVLPGVLHTLGPAAGETLAHVPENVKTALSKGSDVAAAAKEAITPGTPESRAASAMKRAVAPEGLKVEEQAHFRDMMGALQRHIPEYTKGKKIAEGPGTATTPGGAELSTKLVDQAQDNLWKDNVEPVAEKIGPLKIPVDNVAQAAKAAATPANAESELPAITKYATKFEKGPWTVKQALDEIRDLNNNKSVSRFYAANAQDQSAMLLADPALRGKVAALRSLKDTVFSKAEDEIGPKQVENFKQARRDWGYLNDALDWMNDVRSPNPLPWTTRAMNSIRGIVGLKSGPGGVAKVAADTLGRKDNPDYLLPRVMNELGKLRGVGRQYVNPITRQPFGALPAIGETGEGDASQILGGVRGTVNGEERGLTESGNVPGGPSTALPAVRVGESGGAPSQFNSPATNPNLGVSSATTPIDQGLARVEGRTYRAGSTIPAGTATPEVAIRSNEPASRIPGLDRLGKFRGEQQAIVDDPATTASQKAVAKGLLEKVDAALDVFSGSHPHPLELRLGFVRIKDSAGSIHDIPQEALSAALKRDPGVKVVSTEFVGPSVQK